MSIYRRKSGRYGVLVDLEPSPTCLRRRKSRHAVATWALSEGSDVRSVAALLGHSVPSTTLNVYAHVVAGAQERAVAAVSNVLTEAQARRAEGANGHA